MVRLCQGSGFQGTPMEPRAPLPAVKGFIYEAAVKLFPSPPREPLID